VPNILQDLFSYSSQRTVVHNINPSLKMLAILCLELIAFSLVGLQFSIPLLLLVIALLLVAKVPLGTVRTFLAAILWMVIIAQISFTLIAPAMGDTVIFTLKTKSIYLENVLAGLSISIRLATMTMLSALLIATTSQREIVLGLRGLGLPYSLASIVGLTFRTVITLATDWEIIRQAQYARCLDVDDGNLIEKMKKRASVGMPLTAALVNKMDHLSVALECRAVGSSKKPVEYFQARTEWWETALMILITLLTIGVIWMQSVYHTFG
jgi:energy-coupling factor transport system permease protein